MDFWTIFSITLAVISLCVSGIALWLQLKDRPKIEVESIHPCLASWKESEEHLWEHQIKSIDVKIKNSGARALSGIRALITFPGLPPLQLYPLENGCANFDKSTFTLEPESSITLFGTWSMNPSLKPDSESPAHSEFLKHGLPATVTLSNGTRECRKVLSLKNGAKMVNKSIETTYLHG